MDQCTAKLGNGSDSGSFNYPGLQVMTGQDNAEAIYRLASKQWAFFP